MIHQLHKHTHATPASVHTCNFFFRNYFVTLIHLLHHLQLLWKTIVHIPPHLLITVVIETITFTSIHTSMMSSGYMHFCYLEQKLLFVLSYSVSAIKKEEPYIDHHKLLSESEMLVIDLQLPFRSVVCRERMKMSNYVLEKKRKRS